MDLSNLVESGELLLVLIGGLGANSVLSILSFIKTTVSGKKFTKVSDFAVVADQSIKFAKTEIKQLKGEIVDEVMSKVVEPLKGQVKQLASDNAQLASMTVSLLTLIPMPLEVKKDAVKVISALGSISTEAKSLLQTSIANQEQQTVAESQENNQLSDSIKDI